MKTSIKLRRARALIEEGWCKGAFAKNRAGKAVNTQAIEAVRWCALGACYCARVDFFFLAMAAYELSTSVAMFNDKQTHKGPVLKLFDRAIELAKKEETR